MHVTLDPLYIFNVSLCVSLNSHPNSQYFAAKLSCHMDYGRLCHMSPNMVEQEFRANFPDCYVGF